MNRRSFIISTVSAGILAAASGCARALEPARTEVVYFYRTVRCPSCIQIENWTRDAVAPGVTAGRVTWLTLNLDEPQNVQFEDRYGLMAQSVVLREFRGEKETRWKNLDKVWGLLDDQKVFAKYILDELNAFMATKPETTS